ncbi:hypothetical protein D3C77_667950 [compost metagenome]
MELPSWVSQAIQNRLDEVSGKIENDSALRQVRREERRLLYAMFENESIVQSPAFQAWEDQHHYMQSLIQEQLYKQGMKDGIQLVYSLWKNVREL